MIIARLRFSYVVMVSDSLCDAFIASLYCFSAMIPRVVNLKFWIVCVFILIVISNEKLH